MKFDFSTFVTVLVALVVFKFVDKMFLDKMTTSTLEMLGGNSDND